MNFLIKSILIILLLASCREKENLQTSDDARDLLNQQRYEDAIALLQADLDQNSDDDEQRFLLASAYAGLVGVDIVTNYDAVAFFLDAKVRFSKVKAPSRAKADLTSEEKFKENLIEIFKISFEYLDLGFKLPMLNQEKLLHLNQAEIHLQKIEPDSLWYRDRRTYQGLLKFIRFFYEIRKSLLFNGTEIRSPIDFICSIDKFALNSRLKIALEELDEGFVAIKDVVSDSKDKKKLDDYIDLVVDTKSFLDDRQGDIQLGILLTELSEVFYCD
ncbi:tetratricopeptide repeat protein [Pseudobacteriovorax antillogorgiicola]|uniref:Uncharacterized protein n=1 Tax=Pseudobacteriovorax antillogorgiicola TaxID=1513793 RepID=A0A1Y6CNZ6_9BACT|nr:tetratricopeptide repeat protein [Pseudobacteriovorax antillogorgiicola]TCS47013.1 hypothetical protein EDD56_122108 [Pseudobacteriovorax antillogorgiicola]SMF65078.1 hypothetical protein SAMN06296036_122108 [Pseudobacteriovorax antillogorgiicola]